MSTSPGRRAAFEVVRRTLAEGAYTDRALHAETRGLDPRDRAFAKRLAFGTVQRRGTFDWIVAQHTTRKRLDPEVRAALHLGLEQLLFLDGVADHAAISESVELAKPNSGVARWSEMRYEVPPDWMHGPHDGYGEYVHRWQPANTSN